MILLSTVDESNTGIVVAVRRRRFSERLLLRLRSVLHMTHAKPCPLSFMYVQAMHSHEDDDVVDGEG